jgi:hypothetical protein
MYFSDACRQRACRTRNKGQHDLARIIREAHERFYLKLDQDVHRETWQDDLEEAHKRLTAYEKDHAHRDDLLLGVLEDQRHLREYIASLEEQLAEKEAEIIRLTMLLEGPSKKKLR